MSEQDNVRDVLKEMIEISEAKSITTEGRESSDKQFTGCRWV